MKTWNPVPRRLSGLTRLALLLSVCGGTFASVTTGCTAAELEPVPQPERPPRRQ